jgi:DNA-binding transcriptional LysR family regulator
MRKSNPVFVSHALAVANHLSFRRAAKALGIWQSALSRGVRALEDELGVSLFERHRTGVRVTHAGTRFFEQARDALEQLDHASRIAGAAGQGGTGQLSIGIRSSMAAGFLRELIQAYSARHPGVGIDIIEGASAEHISLVRRRKLDVAFVSDASEAVDCDVTPLWNERLFVVLPQNHRLRSRKAVEWRALRNEHFIVRQSKSGSGLSKRLVNLLSDRARAPSLQRVDVGREALMHLVAMGRGVSLTTEATIAMSFPEVIFRPISGGDETLQFSAVWAPGNDNPALRRFLSLARARAKERRQHQHERLPKRQPRSILTGGNRSVAGFSRRVRKKARSVAMNRASIGATSFAGSTAWPMPRPSTSA